MNTPLNIADHSPLGAPQDPMGNRRDPLAPMNQDRELLQQTTAGYSQTKDQLEKQQVDDKDKEFIELYDKMKKMGFISSRDFDEKLNIHEKADVVKDFEIRIAAHEKRLIEKEMMLDKQIAEMVRMQQHAAPQNTGRLDSMPEPEPPNPLLKFSKTR